MDHDATIAGARGCPNCGTLTAGVKFCPECGQDARSDRIFFTDLFRHALDQLFDADSRWRVTLSAVFPHPGALAEEYVAGKRMRYVNPVRFFLVLMLLVFFGQELIAIALGEGLSAASRWIPILALAWVVPAAVLLRIAFNVTRRSVAESCAFVLFAMGPAMIFYGLVGAVLWVSDANQYIDPRHFLYTVLAGWAVVTMYWGAGATRFFHANPFYAFAVTIVISGLMLLGFSGSHHLVSWVG